MAKRNRRDKKQRIALNSYTKGGRISSVMAIVSALILISTIVVCIILDGGAGIYAGLLALLSFGISLAGFYIGIKSYQEETKFLRYTYIGTISNAVIWIGLLCVYLVYV